MMRAENIYRISSFLYLHHFYFLSRIFEYLNRLLHHSHIPASTRIGKNTIFGYGGINVVIHNQTSIGDHCMISQNVTIGGKNGIKSVPKIEDNIFIGPGAVILGDIIIGHDFNNRC